MDRDDLVERLEAADLYTYDAHTGAIEYSALSEKAAAEIRSLRAQVADAEDALTVSYLAGRKDGAEKERVGIVKYLRDDEYYVRRMLRPVRTSAELADAIEAQQDKEPQT